MAALNRQNPNLDEFVGFKWSSWIDRANILTSDEECNKYGRKRTETLTLRKEDMYIYGHCPAHDDFYLVVCSHCDQVVKPQAFEKHCERRHGLMSQLCSPPSSHQQCLWPVRPPSLVLPSREKLDGRHQKAGPPSTTPSLTQHRPAEPQKDEVGLPPAENLSQEALSSSSSYSSSPLPRVSPWQSGPQPPEERPSPTPEQLLLQRATAGQPEDHQPAPQGPGTYSRTFKKFYNKICDLDKHCGVLDPERKKPCTRQLMCNIHSIHQRRKVVGRRKTFDQLLTEQRAGSKGPDLARSQVCKDSLKEPSPHTQPPGDPSGHHQLSPNNCSILRSRELLESGEDEEEETRVEVQPPYPFNQSLPSSEGSDSEDQEAAEEDLPFAPWHPRPLGLCSFGSHTMGCSVFTFDRRWHHLRLAFSAMVEHHLSSHLWKKLPQMTGLRSYQAAATPPTSTGLSVRAGGRAAPPTGPSLRTPHTPHPHRATGRENCSSGSASSGQPQTKSSQHNLPSSTFRHPSPVSGLGRPRNPVGRPSKARLRERELIRAVNSEKTKPPHNKGRAPKRAKDHPLQERDWSPAPARVYPSASFQGPVNGALTTLGKKPCLLPHPSKRYSPSPGLGKRPLPPPLRPPHPSPRGRGRPPGLHRRVVGYDHRGLVKKFKDNSGSPTLSPPPSLPPPPHPTLLSWRGESMGVGTLQRRREEE